MIAIVHSIYSQSVHAPASHARLMDNEAERYCICVPLPGINPNCESLNSWVLLSSRTYISKNFDDVVKMTIGLQFYGMDVSHCTH